MVRVVLDTNVLVSAFRNKGKSRSLFASLMEKHEVILSSQILAELADVLSRDKFNVTTAQIDKFLSILVRYAIVVPVQSTSKIIVEDPDDDVILDTAFCGKAEYVVSGDKHLLKIGRYQNVQILSVNEFLEKISKKQM
jgi:putative PIN family toxin of toxin-antitoxin system